MLASPRKGLRAWTGSVATPAQSRQWRFYAESLIEQAIRILDAIDGDVDLEDGGDLETSLASPVGGESQIVWCAGCEDDREICCPTATKPTTTISCTHQHG